jgi:hypothetical protein
MGNTTVAGILVGNMTRVTATFRDSQNVINDPDQVKFKLKLPEGTVTDYEYGIDDEITKISPGIYFVDIPLDTAGRYDYYFYSTGHGQAADQGSFIVIDKAIQG